ncbi:MAG TPA: DUF3465 domain-containing protein [Candidatus Tumulicola sp.]
MRNATAIVAAAIAAAAIALTACASGGSSAPDNAAVCRAFSAAQSHAEVTAQGTVVREFGVRPGRESAHEGFLMRLSSDCDVVVRVEANVDFTGSFALRRGQTVEVRGEYEYYSSGGVIHWTHRDPRGRHADGYIKVDGHNYG